MVPTAGLEPAQVAPLAPQTSASTNFATSAFQLAIRPKLSTGFAERTPTNRRRGAPLKQNPTLAKDTARRNHMHQIISAARSVPVQASQELELELEREREPQVPARQAHRQPAPEYLVRAWSPEQVRSTTIAPARW
jgi:hypothetical protein